MGPDFHMRLLRIVETMWAVLERKRCLIEQLELMLRDADRWLVGRRVGSQSKTEPPPLRPRVRA
jgi:hypothetical protein